MTGDCAAACAACSWPDGIMLVFMWCITHSEPASTMTTRTPVNTSASRFQPPSAFGLMCRKYTICTTTCSAAQTRITPTRTGVASATLAMTSANVTPA